jgi:hypothetical protein
MPIIFFFLRDRYIEKEERQRAKEKEQIYSTYYKKPDKITKKKQSNLYIIINDRDSFLLNHRTLILW